MQINQTSGATPQAHYYAARLQRELLAYLNYQYNWTLIPNLTEKSTPESSIQQKPDQSEITPDYSAK